MYDVCSLPLFLPHTSKVLFLALSVTLFVPRISLKPLNGFEPNSQGRRVWSLAWMSLNVKVNVTRYKNVLCTPITPWQRRNGARSLQMTSRSSSLDHCLIAGGVISGPMCSLFDNTSLALVVP